MQQRRLVRDGNALEGTVRLDRDKTLKNLSCLMIGLGGVIYYRDLSSLIVLGLVAYLTMYVGVVAYHRLLIHKSFKCPKIVEYTLIFVANFSGMGGPISLVEFHELRDWAQRKPECHAFFAHRYSVLRDGFQQMFCRIDLVNPPEFKIEVSAFYRHMEKYWWLYQIPLGLILYYFGGWAWVSTGVFLKLFTVQCGHWLVAYYLHNYGEQPRMMKNAGVQGYNIPILAFLTFGESYHNNHHSCPEAAHVGFDKGQIDPAWWLILGLKKLKLAHHITTPTGVGGEENLT